jgi:xanthine dehydrogenase accessory factor
MYDEFFSKAQELLSDGVPFATATVVRAEKPTSGKPGDKAIITPNGVMHGWIGGSCAQETVVQEALKALEEREPRFIRLSTDPHPAPARDGLIVLPMTCFSGGTLEIYIEPQFPSPRLIVVGNLPVAQALVQLGKALSYHVIAVDLEGEGAGMSAADEILTDLAQLNAKVTPFTYVVVASHGHYDELALEQVLPSQAAYVTLVASRKRAAAMLDFLRGQGLSETVLGRLKYPAGLDIQAHRGDEIALSIMAEIVQKRRTAELLDVEALFEFDAEPIRLATAIDPVCGMTVEIANARYRSEHAGEVYYFCAAGCKAAFDKDPHSYLTAISR